MRRAAALAAAALLAGCATPGGVGALAGPSEGYLTPGMLGPLANAAGLSSEAASGPAWLPPVAPGTDRWWMATAHAELRPPWAAQHFDCALDTRLAERPRPALTRMMGRLAVDVVALARQRLAHAGVVSRPRPFVALDGLEPCERASGAGRAVPSSPAAGAVLAGAYGELFAKLAPDAADAVRGTAREIGWSRAVCRMNWPADVEAGLELGARLFEAAATRPDFAADLAAARDELSAARAEGLASPACAAERRARRQWRAPDGPPGPSS